jgi:hypothetical protein
MIGERDDPLDLANLRLPAGVSERLAVVPRKIKKRRQQFIQVPWSWFERLDGASGHTYRLALLLLYLNWKDKGAPIKLANGELKIDSLSRQTKWRALRELERRSLITIDCRPKKSPRVRVFA